MATIAISEEKLKEIIAFICNCTVANITDTTSVSNLDGWDSLAHMNLVLALEQAFDVTFTEDESVEILSYALIKHTLSGHGVTFL